MDYPNNKALELDDELRAEMEIDLELSKQERSILAGLMETVFMPMDLISDQATLADLINKRLVHQMELTNVVTITFRGIEAYKEIHQSG